MVGHPGRPRVRLDYDMVGAATAAVPSRTGLDNSVGGRRLAIVPSMLEADFGRLAEEVRALDEAGADRLQFDVMDGHFVPALTHGPAVLRSVRTETDLPFEAHLMIDRPEDSWRLYAEAGADVIIVHAETTPHLHLLLSDIRAAGRRAGVALNPATPLESIVDVVDLLDLLLVMTVNPGRGGQALIPAMIGKVARARQLLDRAASPADLEIDGGLTVATTPDLVRNGANVLIAGSAIHRHGAGRAAAIAGLRAAARSALSAPDRPQRGARDA
jgi:ribulose-phosphate 3-epimerase